MPTTTFHYFCLLQNGTDVDLLPFCLCDCTSLFQCLLPFLCKKKKFNFIFQIFKLNKLKKLKMGDVLYMKWHMSKYQVTASFLGSNLHKRAILECISVLRFWQRQSVCTNPSNTDRTVIMPWKKKGESEYKC